ncbi:hypothetical protein C8R47DRAFT_1228756 [Mycena vitilis]|nr:hypothetical protein C8R47DRAFT_1228756 [Mycena vitilis]
MKADADDEAEDEEVAAALRADRRAGKQRTLEDSAEAKKIDWEIPRKVLHSSIGFITLGPYLKLSISPCMVTLVLWSALAVIAPTDAMRLRVPAIERVYERCLSFLVCESEHPHEWHMVHARRQLSLTFYFIAVATVAILMLLSSLFATPVRALVPSVSHKRMGCFTSLLFFVGASVCGQGGIAFSLHWFSFGVLASTYAWPVSSFSSLRLYPEGSTRDVQYFAAPPDCGGAIEIPPSFEERVIAEKGSGSVRPQASTES